MCGAAQYFPILLLPRTLSDAMEGMVSVRRVEQFLLAEELTATVVHESPESGPVEVRHAVTVSQHDVCPHRLCVWRRCVLYALFVVVVIVVVVVVVVAVVIVAVVIVDVAIVAVVVVPFVVGVVTS